MTKPELGTKRRCNSCATKFFDLNNDPIVCPKCMAVFVSPQPDPVRSRRQSERQAWPVPKDAAHTVPNEIASLDGTNADQETKSPVAEDILLTDDQDGELLGAGLGKKKMTHNVSRRPPTLCQANALGRQLGTDVPGRT
jgi:uncharacterized protein (TIGR02300 family)